MHAFVHRWFFHSQLLRAVVSAALCLGLVLFSAPVGAVEPDDCDNNSEPIGALKSGDNVAELSGSDDKIYFLAGVFLVDWPTLPAVIRHRLEIRRTTIIRDFLDQGALSVVAAEATVDRFGRRPVYLFAENHTGRHWLQRKLVEGGLALVHPHRAQGPKRARGMAEKIENCLVVLFEAEKRARIQGAGIWQELTHAVMKSDDNNWRTRVDSYRIVEGRVRSVGQTGARIYLNFGTNWREDFTVIVAKRNVKRFKKTIEELKAVSGQEISVRGWVTSDRGPLIEVYYPGQIELKHGNAKHR